MILPVTCLGFIKGGWNLRKAWKIYEKAYEQIVELLKARNVTYAVTEFVVTKIAVFNLLSKTRICI